MTHTRPPDSSEAPKTVTFPKHSGQELLSHPPNQPNLSDVNESEVKIGDLPDKDTSGRKKKIWIDLDNSPHVPFFVPIINRLQSSGYEIVLTARNAYQVCDLLNFYNIKAQVIGKHFGKHKIFKVLGTMQRIFQLVRVIRMQRPDVSLSHGSRAGILASRLLGIESIALNDYEFSNKLKLVGPNWLMFPEVVPDERIRVRNVKILKYPGLKEDVYLSNLHPDEQLRARLGIKDDELLITVRPPATEAHYHNPESEILLTEVLRKCSQNPNTKTLLLCRNKGQESELRAAWAKEIASGNIVIPSHVEDGLNIIWNSDLVISGGGTMNREAAALKVPVYSIFRGKIGAVDRYLAESGRLILLESVGDVHHKISLTRKERRAPSQIENGRTLETIIRYIENILQSQSRRGLSRPARVNK